MGCVVLKATREEVPEWFADFAADMCSLMVAISASSSSHQKAISQEFCKLLRAKPGLLAKFVEVATAEEKGKGPQFEPLAGLCLHTRNLDNYEADFKQLFMAMYMREVVTSRDQRTVRELACFSPFLETLTHDDMKELQVIYSGLSILWQSFHISACLVAQHMDHA